MEHLSIEEIIMYVTETKVNDDTLKLFSRVNGHIRNCPHCKEKLNSYELINDNLTNGNLMHDFDLNHENDLIEIEQSNDSKHYF